MRKNLKTIILIFTLLFCPLIFSNASDSYIIGSDDVLEIKFWQDDTNRLDANIKVRQDGKIALDIIGEIQAAGKTTYELERDIVRQMSRYNQSISQTVVRVLTYGFQKVYMAGQVLTPGKYTFEKIPDLWTLINEAGGISEFGDLSQILITRAETKEIEVVDVGKAVARGMAHELPVILKGDIVEVTRLPGGLQSPGSISLIGGGKKIFYISGEVNAPGQYTLEENIDILDAISIAGGTTERAKLTGVKLISKGNDGSQVIKFDLEKYTEFGSPGRLMVGPEDNIVVDRKSGGFLGFGSVTDLVAIVGAATSAVLLYETLKGSDGN